MRGEHETRSGLLPFDMGSSPHARGALKSMWDDVTGWGIIPACAGSTLRDQRVWSTFSLNTFTFCKL